MREQAKRLFAVLEERSSVFDAYPRRLCRNLVHSLLDFARRHEEWVRDPEDWSGLPDADPAQQFADFFCHLWLPWMPPALLLRIFETPRWLESEALQWVFFTGRGGNLRKAPGFPVTLTRKAAHWAGKIPPHLGFADGLLWSVLKGAEVSDGFIEEIRNSHWWRQLSFRVERGLTGLSEERWDAETFQWVIDLVRILESSKDSRTSDLGPLVDYLHHCPQVVLKGRTFASLVRHMNAWHQDLTRRFVEEWEATQEWDRKRDNRLTWDPERRVRPFFLFDRQGCCHWKIEELTTFTALQREGGALRHCVASYVEYCVKHACSIWSLRKVNPGARGRSLATMEVRRAPGGGLRLIQARARGNQRPGKKEAGLIRQWMALNGITTTFRF